MRRSNFGVYLVLFASMARTAAAADVAEFIDYSLTAPRGNVVLPGRLYVPPEAVADPTTMRPLVVFLHGGGAAGTDNVTQVLHTPDFLLDEAKRRGAYLYVPQAPSTWASTSIIDFVMMMIDRAVTERNLDVDRLYATGYSNGGGGTWNLLSRHPDRFAAAMTVSGVAPASGFVAQNLLGTAILAVHARDDATVPVARSRDVVSGILAAAGESLPTYPSTGSDQILLVSNPAYEFHRLAVDEQPPGSTTNFFIARPDLELMYFESPNGGHTGLLSVYYAPPIYDWMFSHGAPVPEPATLVLSCVGLTAAIMASRRWTAAWRRAWQAK
jgi:predicted peptidase